uniref:non-specific protein-tyrosine kinase n=1 Tax=Hucho hucho TaxID=62062 RepID=A0A4W5QC95_9TELE
CGVLCITPLCHVLFSLYDPESHCWYSPNHFFNPEEQTSLTLHYRMRFYFRNWHGLSEKEPSVVRYAPRSGTEHGGSPLLEMTSLEYLFCQVSFRMRCVLSKMCLYSYIPVEVCPAHSFMRCIPRSFSKHIVRDNFLTKIRIRRVFAKFVRTFQEHTVDLGRLGSQEVMYKYLSTLEQLAPRFGTETFLTAHLELRKDGGDGSGSYLNTSHAHGASDPENFGPQAMHEVMVSGTKGIQWRKITVQKAQANSYFGNDYLGNRKSVKQSPLQQEPKSFDTWTSFCDFPEISHITITGANVSIIKQDNFSMEVQMNSSLEALSFVSLLDGYFRLTADAHHYLCHEVAPPRVVLSATNGLHGPMNTSKMAVCPCAQEQHLGRGTRTNIYLGSLLVWGREEEEEEEDEEDKWNNNLTDRKEIRVVLKILDQSHKDIALVSYHYCIIILLQELIEFVEFGPLDVFLRRERALVTPQWKYTVAKQLASALSYLETKQLVHGNVCAKNILVARRGLEEGTFPFVKLSDPGIALNVLSREERVERIPWIAPECVPSGAPIGSAADQWSFGATLLEICNNGDLPMSGSTLTEKERFYETRSRLTEPSSQELASFISMCLTYEPRERPSFRTVLRELTELQIKNPDISPLESLPDANPNVFLKRYLKKIRDLGEGHFGKVMLYVYDPANDGTGDYVAVKALKHEGGSHLHEGWMKEIEILKSLYHSNIVKYKGCCSELGGQTVQLIMEFLPLGSLREYLAKHRLGVAHSLLFAQQICQGMDYLHSKRYIHRDLAARNVLVENEHLVKIGDFGLTKYIPEGDVYYRVREDGDSPVYWYAIECLKESKFSFSSDIWSFGVTLYEVLTHGDHRQSPPVV